MSSLDQAHKNPSSNDNVGAQTSVHHSSNIQSDSQGVVSGAKTIQANQAGFTDDDATGSNPGGPSTDIQDYYAIFGDTEANIIRFPDYDLKDDPDRSQLEFGTQGPFLSEMNYPGGSSKTHVWYQLDSGSLSIVETYDDTPDDSSLVAAGKPFFLAATCVHPQNAPPFLQGNLLAVVNQAIQLRNPVRQIAELLSRIGAGGIIEGLGITPIPGTLTITRAEGKAYFFSGFPENEALVSTFEGDELIAPNIAKWTSDPVTGEVVVIPGPASPDFEVTLYAQAGSIVSIPVGRWWQIMTILQHHDDRAEATGHLYGQQLFRTQDEAIAALNRVAVNPPLSFKQGGWYHVADVVVASDCTDLADPLQARFFNVINKSIRSQDDDLDLSRAPAVSTSVTANRRAYHGDVLGVDTTLGSITITADESCNGFTVYDEAGMWNMNAVTIDLDGSLVVVNQKSREYVFRRDSGTVWSAFFRGILVVL